ncbi:MAG: ABC transporter ATP-binding protein [Actinobacteria bacterium]|nr:MAG: ABC transporter ATP-binding protein [Actinomycetota bacterium]
MDTREHAVLAEEISYSYGEQKAVDRVSFHIDEGEVLGLLGPNGAGKTTTLKMLIGLLLPQSGRVSILGMDMARERERIQALIGVCFEEKNLYEEMSAADNLKFFGSLFDLRRVDAEGLLEKMGLPAARKDKVGNFSKGMKQRLMMARALVNHPRVLFLDEPTDGLDPVSAETIRKIILEEKELGATVFLTTHDMMEADRLSDRVGFMNEGKIVALDTPDNLKHEYGKRVLKIRYQDDGRLRERELPLEDPETGRTIQRILAEREVRDMHTEEATLEDIFIRFTGRKLRE